MTSAEEAIAAAEKVAAGSSDDDTRAKKLSAARQAATTALIEAHREEFNGYMMAEAEARGVEWKRKLSAAERAEKELDALVKANPGLAEVLKEKYALTGGSPAPTASQSYPAGQAAPPA